MFQLPIEIDWDFTVSRKTSIVKPQVSDIQYIFRYTIKLFSFLHVIVNQSQWNVEKFPQSNLNALFCLFALTSSFCLSKEQNNKLKN